MRVRRDSAGAVSGWTIAAAVVILSLLSLAGWRGMAPSAGAAPEGGASHFALPRSSTQLIVGVASDWNANKVTLQRYERKPQGKWQLVGERFEGRLGANGLAWGRGLHPQMPSPPGPSAKREGDKRSPAGVFTLGQAFGYEADVPRHAGLKYLQVTPNDLFVEDPTSPLYNAHIRLDHAPSTPWELSQQMEQSNPAHALEVVINHNMVPRPVPGAGSAILFHIWRRDGAANTAGCTSMHEENIREMVAWLDPTRTPLYVLLPQSEYDALSSKWLLPASMKSAPTATKTVPGTSVRARLLQPLEPSSTTASVPAGGAPVKAAVIPSSVPLSNAAKQALDALRKP